MTDGGIDTDTIAGSPTRSGRRGWIVAIVAGVFLIGCAAVVLKIPVTVTVSWPNEGTGTGVGEFGSPFIQTADVNCGAPITSGPDGLFYGGGPDGRSGTVPYPCADTFRTRRIISGVLAGIGVGLLATGVVVRRRYRTAVPGT